MTKYQPIGQDHPTKVPEYGSEVKSNAPKMPTKPPMPKVKPPKDDWEIPGFMLKKRKETITFYGWDGKEYVFEKE